MTLDAFHKKCHNLVDWSGVKWLFETFSPQRLAERKKGRIYQGGESRDLFRLFRTCIRTRPVRKLFIISLILNEFSCGDVHMS